MAKFKVVLTEPFENAEVEKPILEKIKAEVECLNSIDPDLIVQHGRDADALIIQYARISSQVVAELKKCKVIVRAGVGYDNIDLQAAAEKNIYVANVRDYGNQEVSTQAITLLLACARKILPLHRNVRRNNWSFVNHKPIFRLWKNQKAGLIGFGKIAQDMAKKCQAFGLNVVSYDPFVSEEKMREFSVQKVELDTLLKVSDYVSIHAPLTETTHHLLSESQFGIMKPTAYVINTARGPLIDEKALYQALKEGRIAGAGLDVLEKEPPDEDNPLLTLDNVIITPHSAYYSEESIRTLRETSAAQVVEVLHHKRPPKYLVNHNELKKEQIGKG